MEKGSGFLCGGRVMADGRGRRNWYRWTIPVISALGDGPVMTMPELYRSSYE